MRLVLLVKPPFVSSPAAEGLTVLTSPLARVTIGSLTAPAVDPHRSVAQFLARLGEPSPRLIADEQRRSRHGWPVRIVRAQVAARAGAASIKGEGQAYQAVFVYYQCLKHSAEITAQITATDYQTTLPPGLLALLLSGRPDFRPDTESIVALSEIWEP